MTTCPSGVHYQHLIDHARVHVEQTYRRPLPERWLRALLAAVLPYPRRVARRAGARRRSRGRSRGLLPARAARDARARRGAQWPRRAAAAPRRGERSAALRRARASRLLTGCVQNVIAPADQRRDDPPARALRRRSRRRSAAAAARSCITSARSRRERARRGARRAAARPSSTGRGLDAIVANASGCGTHVKDYGYMFRDDARSPRRRRPSARRRAT